MKRITLLLLTIGLLLVASCGTENNEFTNNDTDGSNTISEPLPNDISHDMSKPGAVTEVSDESIDEESEPMEESFEVYVPNPDYFPDESDAKLWVDKTEYYYGENIIVHFSGTDEKDWIGFYGGSDEPGGVASIVWKYSVGEGDLVFNTGSIGKSGKFTAFLCDNDGYNVLDKVTVYILDVNADTNDYGARSVDLKVTFGENGVSHAVATVTPSTEKNVEYRLYWSKNGSPLEGYEPIYTAQHSGIAPFDIVLNDGIFMPDDADGVCILVDEGKSSVCSTAATDELKLEASEHLFDFAVITDLHISLQHSEFTSHLRSAFKNISEVYPECTAVFTVGDNTDKGLAEQYVLLMDTIASCKPVAPVYFTLGNHDLMYGNDYTEQVNLFRYYTGMKSPYYSVTLKDIKFIVLASDSLKGEGTMGQKELEWLKSELAKCDKSDRVFLFMHQPLIETVSGSIYSRDNEIQDWFGFSDSGDSIHDMLRDYPNAVLFTGHTHWTLESYRPVLLGNGKDANFVNCASVAYLWTDMDDSTGGSEGIFVEVYEDYILIRGREFMNNTWCAATQIRIPRT